MTRYIYEFDGKDFSDLTVVQAYRDVEIVKARAANEAERGAQHRRILSLMYDPIVRRRA